MARILILGAGIGGMPMAYEMREKARAEDQITVVSNAPYFHFTPSNPWVAVNWRTRDDISLDIAPLLERKNIDFISVGAKRVHPERNVLELNDGRELEYDFLIIATGPKLAFDEVEGLGPKGHTSSICHVEHAVESGKAWDEFVKDPGPIVSARCRGRILLRPGLRIRLHRGRRPAQAQNPPPRADHLSSPAEPYIGHLGLGGVGDSKSMMESEMRDTTRQVDHQCAQRPASKPASCSSTELDDRGTSARNTNCRSAWP
jgi:sulfide:quinone oxidoreductase